jgi:DNA-binding GntR family transcriptional regulator
MQCATRRESAHTSQPTSASSVVARTPRTKTAYALDSLRQAILAGDIRPGERLSVVRLSERLGVSPTPVREAIRQLQAEGFLSHEPHHQVSVADLSAEDAHEIYTLRVLLETMAVRLAAPRLGSEMIESLDAMVAKAQAALADGDIETLRALNREWHFAIYDASNTRYLCEFIARLWVNVRWDAIYDVPGRAQRSLAQHREILAALASADGDQASLLMERHITSSERVANEHLIGR